jgi:hypothetical protein
MPGSCSAACANTGDASAADRSAAALKAAPKVLNLVMIGFLNVRDPVRVCADLLADKTRVRVRIIPGK